MKIKAESRKKIISILAVSLIVGLSITTIVFGTRYKKYEYRLQANQQSAVIALSEYTDKINTDLKKSLYAGTALMANEISADLLRNCACAKTALSQLSAPDTFLLGTYKFLSQVGAVSASMSKNPSATHDNTLTLLKYSSTLSSQIDSLLSSYDAAKDFKGGDNVIHTSLSDIEQSFADYPTLIYDGPFSDHNNQEDAGMLKDLPVISEKTAKALASKYSGIDRENLLTAEAETGSFDCFVFSTESTEISVTKRGGLLCSILTSNRSGEGKLTFEEAIKKGQEYLGSIGYPNMESTYYYSNDGECVINYALKVDGIICYTDMIKVSVALDDARILNVDARSYIMNHKDRSVLKTKLEGAITAESAQKNLSKNLKVKSVKTALIPSETDHEFLCYEFLCTGLYDEEILVYVDVGTGTEKQIFLLLHSAGGTLTK